MPNPVAEDVNRGTASVFSDVGSSAVTQVLVVLANLATLRLAASLMTPEQVGEYALVRRLLVFLAPMLLLGLGVGLPRTLGRARQDPQYVGVIALAGGALGISVATLTALLLVLFPGAMARLLFGAREHARLVELLAPLVFGHQLFLVAYGVLRGELRIRHANALQLVVIGLLPVMAVATVGRRGVETVLLTLGLVTSVLGTIAALRVCTTAIRRAALQRWRGALRELATYSAPRVPGELALTGLYALGPILAAHELDLGAAGLLAIGVSLITVLSSAFVPLGVALLPRMSWMFAAAGREGLQRRLPLLCGLSLYCAALLAIACSVFGNTWLRWMLGDGFQLDATALVLLALAAAGNVVFVVLRSVLDAAFVRPINALHASIALACMLAAWFGGRAWLARSPFIVICAAIATAFTVLASLTALAIWKRCGLRLRFTAVLQWCATTVVATLTALALRRSLGDAGTLAALGGQIALVAVWLVTLAVLRVRWPFELAGALFGRLRPRIARTSDAPPAVPVPTRHVLCTTERDEEVPAPAPEVIRELHS